MQKQSQRRQRYLFAILSYLLSITILLGTLFWFMSVYGFSQNNFIVGSAIVIILAFAWSHLITYELLEPKRKMDAKFEHLSKEILHELNIPLATIGANIEMLQKNQSDERVLKRLQRIQSASLRLKRLYDELAYSIKKELHKVENENFMLDILLKERIDILKEFDRNPFALNINSSMTLCCDKIGFEQVIDNILMNAMKYSPKASEITIWLQGYQLFIQDQGIGIDETELVKIFERYYQSDTKHKGEGIGLALVKTYCDTHAIEIVLKSQKNIGTIVMLDLKNIILQNTKYHK